MEDSYQYRKKICRLCLMKCDKYEFLEGSMRNNMDVLSLKINLRLTEEPAICKNCAEIVKKCLYFKALCLDTHKYIVSFTSGKSSIKIDLKNIYLCKKEYATGVLKDSNICGFCMGLVESCFAISLDNEDDNILQKMLEKCTPELDFSIVKEPIICAPCHGHLKEYFNFVTNCLFVEDEIGKYCETLDTKNNKILIDLTEVVQFTSRNKVTSVEDVNTIDKNKEEKYRIHPEHFFKTDEYENESITAVEDQKLNSLLQFPLRNISLDIIDIDGSKLELQEKFCDGSENIVVKHEEVKRDLENINTIEDYKSDNILLSTRIMSEQVGVIQKEENFVEGQVVHKNQNYVGVEDQKYLFNDEIEIKTDPHDFSFLNPRHSELDQHLLDPLKATVYQCASCPYTTKRKHSLKSHLQIHMDPSNITMYRCESCPFQAKYKCRLKTHSLVHKNISEVIMYRCKSCPYQTIRKHLLKSHSLVHEDPSEVIMYQCEFCPLKTKHKHHLKVHSLIHKDSSEVTMHRCESCPYQTKKKDLLKSHLRSHKDTSEVRMYQCETCSYETKYKCSLVSHSLVHKNPSKLTMFRCESCPYQTKHKRLLRSHLRVHKDASEVKMYYQCEFCPFKTKHKSSLRVHSLVHKDPSKATMFQCDTCSFQTKHRSNLMRHLLVHRDPSKLTMHQCKSCPFQTKRKCSLRVHSLVHVEPSKASVSM